MICILILINNLKKNPKNKQQKKEQNRDLGSMQHGSLYSWSNLMLSIAVATTPEESKGHLEPPFPPDDHDQRVSSTETALPGCDFHRFFFRKK